jgi:protein-disulfide isomerase
MKLLIGVIITALTVSYSETSFSQTSDELKGLEQEIHALKIGQAGLQKELQTIKDMLRTKQAAIAPMEAVEPTRENPTVVSIARGAIKGVANAKVTLIEFTDYQCPFCSRHFQNTLPQIENEYVKTGKVRYVVREFPLEPIHPVAFKAAEAASCSGEQGKYWEMHATLFANQKGLGLQQLSTYAEVIGLDTQKFTDCLDNGKFGAKVRKDLADAKQVGVNGTPTFFVGLTDPKGSEIKAVKKIVGAQNFAAFKAAIDALLEVE